MMVGGQIRINRLKIGRVEKDQVFPARLSSIRLLESSNLRPATLPPSAILIVRKMLDPLPGKIAKSWKAARADQEWESRVRGRMEAFYRQAARPARGRVPADAQAVLFMDEAEMLACLMLDLRRGTAHTRWWWNFLGQTANHINELSGYKGSAVVAGQMMRHPQAAVAAINWLVNRNLAGEALIVLTPDQAEQVLQAISAAYQLAGVQLRPGRFPRPSLTDCPPPWEAAHNHLDLGRERAALLGLSMDMKTRPQVVRTLAYQHQLNAWWQAARYEIDIPSESQAKQPEITSTSSVTRGWKRELLSVDPQASFRPDRSSDQPSDVKPQSEWDQREQSGEGESTTSDHDHTQEVPFDELKSLAASSGQPKMDHAPEETILPGNQHLPMQSKGQLDFSSKKVEITAELTFANGMPTKLGGVLYLINMMAVLDLPERFETDWRLASGVGAWGTLEALARQLLGDEASWLQEDPLWQALAQLDTRPVGQPPGFRLPRSRPRRWPDFELPPVWVKGLPELALVSLSKAQRARIRAAYRPLLAGWLIRVLPFIIARLRLALHLPSPAILPQALLVVPGTFYLTASNLDLVASIESISLAARMAGLDCDPGWVRAFGRFIRFYFE